MHIKYSHYAAHFFHVSYSFYHCFAIFMIFQQFIYQNSYVIMDIPAVTCDVCAHFHFWNTFVFSFCSHFFLTENECSFCHIPQLCAAYKLLQLITACSCYFQLPLAPPCAFFQLIFSFFMLFQQLFRLFNSIGQLHLFI